MKSRHYTSLVAIAAVAIIAFEAGRQSEANHSPAVPVVEPLPTKELGNAESRGPTLETQDLVDNLASAPFDQVYHTISGTSMDTRVDWVKQIKQVALRPQRWAALSSFFKTLIQIDPAAAKKLILDLDKDNRWIALMAVKDAAPPRALKEVTEILMTFEPIEISGCSYNFLRDAIEEWSMMDPVAVKRFVDEHPTELEGYGPTLVSRWAAYDPDAAGDWVAKIEAARAGQEESYRGEDGPGELRKAWIEGYFAHDRAAALDYLVQASDDDAGRRNSWAVQALFNDSPDEARSFILRLPADKQADALDGVAWAADRTIYNDADDLVRSPEFVAEWMMQFPREVWSNNIERVITEWRYKDSGALFAWMSKLPADQRQTVVANYDPYLPRDLAEKEFSDAMKVSEIGLRDQLLQKIMSKSQDSRAQILSSLEKAQLSQEQKEHLTSLIPKPEHEADETQEE